MSQFNEITEVKDYQYAPKGRAITAMIMGIVSVSMWWYPFIFSIPCIVFAIVALALAGSCKNVADKFKGMVKTARITGIIGLILSILWTVLFVFIIVSAVQESTASVVSGFSRYNYYY